MNAPRDLLCRTERGHLAILFFRAHFREIVTICGVCVLVYCSVFLESFYYFLKSLAIFGSYLCSLFFYSSFEFSFLVYACIQFLVHLDTMLSVKLLFYPDIFVSLSLVQFTLSYFPSSLRLSGALFHSYLKSTCIQCLSQLFHGI